MFPSLCLLECIVVAWLLAYSLRLMLLSPSLPFVDRIDETKMRQMSTIKVLMSARGLAWAWPVPVVTMRSCAARECGMPDCATRYSSWRTLQSYHIHWIYSLRPSVDLAYNEFIFITQKMNSATPHTASNDSDKRLWCWNRRRQCWNRRWPKWKQQAIWYSTWPMWYIKYPATTTLTNASNSAHLGTQISLLRDCRVFKYGRGCRHCTTNRR